MTSVVDDRLSSSAQVSRQTITWRATDQAGNAATASIVVNVVDGSKPYIVLLGSTDMIVEAGQPFIDPGARIVDPDRKSVV